MLGLGTPFLDYMHTYVGNFVGLENLQVIVNVFDFIIRYFHSPYPDQQDKQKRVERKAESSIPRYHP